MNDHRDRTNKHTTNRDKESDQRGIKRTNDYKVP